jgi:hypothetical protein
LLLPASRQQKATMSSTHPAEEEQSAGNHSTNQLHNQKQERAHPFQQSFALSKLIPGAEDLAGNPAL